MAPIIVETPTQTVTLRLLSDETLPILQHLERAHLLEILPNDVPSNAAVFGSKLSQLAGSLSPETAERWQQEIAEMRNEWERDF